MSKLLVVQDVKKRIFVMRNKRVILDKDIAKLYGVKPIALRQQVKRNKERFPEDFMFTLKKEETKDLVSQNVIPSLRSLGGYRPLVFTEHGVAMLSSVLRSQKAIKVNIAIMRAFIELRESVLHFSQIRTKLDELERKVRDNRVNIQAIFNAIRRLMEPTTRKPKPKIGFHP